MKKKRLTTLIAYVALILLCVFVVYAVPGIKGLLLDTYITEQGELILSDEVDAYLVRDEKVYYSDFDGKINRLAKSGKLYKAGTKIINLVDDEGNIQSSGCYSKKAGYVVYSYDGYEKKIKSSRVKKIKKSTYEETLNAGSANCNKRKVASGNAMYKVIKNGKWYVTFYLDSKETKKYIEGDTVHIKSGKDYVKAEVYDVVKGKGTGRVILECGVMFEGCLTERHMKMEVVVANATGLVVENQSIIKKKGQIGVLVKNRMGQYIFNPICVKATDGEKSIVYQDIYMDEKSNFVETLGIYDEIIEKPTKEDIKKSY